MANFMRNRIVALLLFYRVLYSSLSLRPKTRGLLPSTTTYREAHGLYTNVARCCKSYFRCPPPTDISPLFCRYVSPLLNYSYFRDSFSLFLICSVENCTAKTIRKLFSSIQTPLILQLVCIVSKTPRVYIYQSTTRNKFICRNYKQSARTFAVWT